MATGSVKWFMESKRLGVIVPDEGAEDLYVQAGAVLGEGPAALAMGTRVRFDIREAERGREAVNVKPLEQDGNGSRARSRQRSRSLMHQ